MLQAALDYARQNLPVFPVQPRGKVPITPHGYKDATTDERVVRKFWTTVPDANIGLALPRGLVAVDIDQPDALQRLKAEDRDLPATATSTTGRGTHYFYRTEVEIRNAVGLFPGIDLRGVGGYVVVPPSVHPTGAHYRWEVPLSPSTVADVPSWLVEAAKKRTDSRARPVEEWREIVSGGVAEGQRNDSVASVAGHLLRRGIDPFVVLDLVLCWNASRCRPPLPEAEVRRTVDSIAGRELRRRASLA